MGSSPGLSLLRGIHLATLLSLFGTLLFMALFDPGTQPALTHRCRRLAEWSAGGALATGLAWFIAESATIADAGNLSETMAAIPPVIADFSFARLLLLRLALLLVLVGLAAITAPLVGLALPLAAAALGIQPWLGHAGEVRGAMGGALIGSEILHLLAAAAWLGGLVPLGLGLALLPTDRLIRLCRRFTRLGLIVVPTVALTGIFQEWVLAGGAAGLAGTPYGRVALLKAALLLAALVLAGTNGFVLTSRLAETNPSDARRRLHVSIAVEAALGLGIILAAGWLADMALGADLRPAPTPPTAVLACLLLPASVLAVAVAVWLGPENHLTRFRKHR
jgi:copper resistance protein D